MQRAPIDGGRFPPCLASVSPFLEEARSILNNPSSEENSLRVAVYLIEHASKAIEASHIDLDEDGAQMMVMFSRAADDLRNQIGSNNPMQQQTHLSSSEFSPEMLAKIASACDTLVPEAVTLLQEAEAFLSSNDTKSAARKFHAATVFLQVLDTLRPLDEHLRNQLHYAAWRTRLCSHLLENFVHEHFGESNIEDTYHFNPEDRLGKGSYGAVYLVTHKRTGEQFACKVINITRIGSHYLHKLHTEITILRESDHPNIVRLREVFFGKRQLMLVMDLCHGGELFEMLTEHGKKGFKERFCARLLSDMLAAIRYLHEHGVVHRDLKLENFLFQSRSPDSVLKLIDFGLSKHYSPEENMHQVVGSAYYTAPEVLQGNYSTGCDVWSIGVIAYMMLTGSPPFYGKSTTDIHNMILHDPVSYTGSRMRNVSPQAIDFCRKLLEKNVETRVTAAQALEHPFICGEGPQHTLTPQESTDLATSLHEFMSMHNLKRLMLEVIAFSLPQDSIEHMREQFLAVDTDRNGTVSLSELRRALENSANSIPGGDVDKIFEAVAFHSATEINYNEFLAAAMCKRVEIDESKLLHAFETLDTTHCGYLGESQIRLALGSDVGEEDVRKMIQEADADGDGRIDYAEFVAYWRSGVIKQRLKRFKALAKRASGAISAIHEMIALARASRSRSRGQSGAEQVAAAPAAAPMERAPVKSDVDPVAAALAAGSSESVIGNALPTTFDSRDSSAPLPKGGTAGSVVSVTAYASLGSGPDGPCAGGDHNLPPLIPVTKLDVSPPDPPSEC